MPERLRLAADRLELRIGHRLLAAVADALRREDLDDVGALFLQLAHLLTQLVGRAAGLVELANRGQDARAGDDAARDRVTQGDVGRRARALNGRDAGHQRDIRVLDHEEHRLGRRLALVVGAAVLAEVPADVVVDVDHPGHHRQAAQVVGGRRRAAGLDRRDFRPLHDDRRVSQHLAGAVDEFRRVDANGLGRLCRDRDRQCQDRRDEQPVHAHDVPSPVNGTKAAPIVHGGHGGAGIQ